MPYPMPYPYLPFPLSTSLRRSAALLACVFFTACGGGGSGGSSSSPASPAPATPDVKPAAAKCAPGASDYLAAGDDDMAALGITCMQSVRAGKETVLQTPNGMARDKAGNIYVLDRAKQVIFKIAPSGTMSVLAGSIARYGSRDGSGSAASFNLNYLSRMIVDHAGNLIVTDTCNNTVRRITPAGVVSTLAGTVEAVCLRGTGRDVPGRDGDGSGAEVVFDRPADIALDVNGDYLVLEQAGIRRVTPAGVVSHVRWTQNPGEKWLMKQPSRIAVTPDGTLFVSEFMRIYRIAGGVASFVAGGNFGEARDGVGADAVVMGPRAMVADAAGDIYFTDGDLLRKVSAGGVVSTLAGKRLGGGARDGTGTEARFSYLGPLLMTAEGNILALDTGAPSIRTVTPAGVVTTSAATAVVSGNVDGKGTAARFNRRNGTAADAAGNLYIADYEGNTVRMVSPDGVVSVFAGNGIKGATFRKPYSIAISPNGALYVADAYQIVRIERGATTVAYSSGSTENFFEDIAVDAEETLAIATSYSVMQVSSSGKIIPGITDVGFGGEGMDDASLQPASIAYDRAGNLYVADASSLAIYKLSKAGKLSRFAGSSFWMGDLDGPVGNAMLGFHGTTEMAFAPNGDMYLSGQGLLRKVTPDGTVSTPVLGWGKPVLGGIAIGNGMLIGLTSYAVVHTPLPAD
jgi:sugar lactone lactonase YvrE